MSNEIARLHAFTLEVAERLYRASCVLGHLAERKKVKTMQTTDIAERLDATADCCTSMNIANLLRTAAAVIRVQEGRIGNLEAEVERLLRQCSQLDDQIMRLDNAIGQTEYGDFEE